MKKVTINKPKEAGTILKKTVKKPLTNKCGHVRELKEADIRAMRSASEILPAKLLKILPKRKRGERGPQKDPKKVSKTLRYSPEVLHYFEDTGKGWQTRIDDVLKEYIRKHPKAKKNEQPKHEKQKHFR